MTDFRRLSLHLRQRLNEVLAVRALRKYRQFKRRAKDLASRLSPHQQRRDPHGKE